MVQSYLQLSQFSLRDTPNLTINTLFTESSNFFWLLTVFYYGLYYSILLINKSVIKNVIGVSLLIIYTCLWQLEKTIGQKMSKSSVESVIMVTGTVAARPPEQVTEVSSVLVSATLFYAYSFTIYSYLFCLCNKNI